MKPHSLWIPKFFSDLEFPSQHNHVCVWGGGVVRGAALVFLAALKKKKCPKQGIPGKPEAKSFPLIISICKLESCSLAASLLCPCLQIQIPVSSQEPGSCSLSPVSTGRCLGELLRQCCWRVCRATWRTCPAGGWIPAPIQDSFCCTLPLLWVWLWLVLCDSILHLPLLSPSPPVHFTRSGVLTVTTVL